MRNTFLTGLGVIALAAAAGAATAQVPPAPVAGAPAPHHSRADPNRQITRAEFVDARIARLTALDTNRDGVVSPEERAAAMQARRAERAGDRFAKLDANGDGSISRAEFDARPQRAEGGPRGRRGHGEGRMHRGSNREAGQRGGQTVDLAQARERLTQTFTRLDKDGDGYLTAAERRDGRTERRQDRRGMHRPSPTAPASE